MKNVEQLEKRWKRLKFSYRLLIACLLFFGFFILYFTAVSSELSRNLAYIVGAVIMLPLYAYIFIWKCPRCGKNYAHYFGQLTYEWPLFKKCAKCELPFGSTCFDEQDLAEQLRMENSKKCPYSHLPEDNTTDICKGCGVVIEKKSEK